MKAQTAAELKALATYDLQELYEHVSEYATADEWPRAKSRKLRDYADAIVAEIHSRW